MIAHILTERRNEAADRRARRAERVAWIGVALAAAAILADVLTTIYS